jgi:hypothetical protein
MNELVHADVFFFVTTIAVVIVAIIFISVLIYFVLILGRIKKIATLIHEEALLFQEDIHDLRANVRNEGFKIKNIFNIVKMFMPGERSKKSKK